MSDVPPGSDFEINLTKGRGWTTLFRDQKKSCACGLFASLTVLEGFYFNQRGKTIHFSEQQHLDGFKQFMHHDFNKAGADGEKLCKYFDMHPFLTTRTKYPPIQDKEGNYVVQPFDFEKVKDPEVKVGSFRDWKLVTAVGDRSIVEEMMEVIEKKQQPLFVNLIIGNDFRNHSGGSIYSENVVGEKFSHSVAIVGFGRENGKDYWLVQNSYGSEWCDSGFIKVARGINLCTIERDVFYPETQEEVGKRKYESISKSQPDDDDFESFGAVIDISGKRLNTEKGKAVKN